MKKPVQNKSILQMIKRDHQILRESLAALKQEEGAKAKVLAELVAPHLKEEEQELFPKIKTYLTKTELENLGVIYLQLRKDLRRKLERRFTLPSFNMVSSFVSSKFSVHRYLKSAILLQPIYFPIDHS